MLVAILIGLVSLAYLIIGLVLVIVSNYKAHRLLRTEASNLLVLPDPNIFSGHSFDVILQDKNWRIIHKLHQQYGPNFGLYYFNRPWVQTVDLDLIKYIWLDRATQHINRTEFDFPFKEFSRSLIQVKDDNWRRQRRAILPALTNHMVRGKQTTKDIEAVLQLVKDGINIKMKNKDGTQFAILDIGDMFMRYSLKVVHNVVVGTGIKIDFLAEKDVWSTRSDHFTKAILHPFVKLTMIFPATRPLFDALIQYHTMGKVTAKIAQKMKARISRVLSSQIMEDDGHLFDVDRASHEEDNEIKFQTHITGKSPKLSSNEVRETDRISYHLLEIMVRGLRDDRIKQDELIDGLFGVLGGGSKTTGETATCLVWYLVRYPHIQQQLRDSILMEGIDSEYLAWCIKETIRLYPAVPLGGGRILGTDVNFNGISLPKGTYVVPSTYSIHHDPNIWPEPEEFKPERWRDTSGHHPAAFMGFGLGPRNCPGGKIATQEIKLVIQLLLTNYRIERCLETPDEYVFSSAAMVYTTLDRPIKVKLIALNNDRN